MKLSDRIKAAIQKIFGKKSTSVSYSGAASPGVSEVSTSIEKSGTNYAEVTTNGATAVGTAVPNNSKFTSDKSISMPMSYEDYIKNSQKFYEEQKQTAYADAATKREGAVADAQASYTQNKATYGNNAEQLSQMGLYGGGYGDYINAQAYAQKRNDVNVANQNQIVENKTADATYGQYIYSINQQLEEKKDQMYASLWEGAQNGTYSAEAIKDIAKEYDLSEDQIKSLQGIVTATLGKTAEETSKNLLAQALIDIETNGDALSDGYLEGLKDLGLSDTDYEKAVGAYNKKVSSQMKETIKSNQDDASIEAIIVNADELYRQGKLDADSYNDIYNEYVNTAYKGCTTAQDYYAALADIKKIGTDKLGVANYDAVVSKINSAINKINNNQTGNSDGTGKTTIDKERINKAKVVSYRKGAGSVLTNGDNFSVNYGGTRYNIEAGAQANANMQTQLNTLATEAGINKGVGTPIVCKTSDGWELYVWSGDSKGWRRCQKRGGNGDYDSLIGKLK